MPINFASSCLALERAVLNSDNAPSGDVAKEAMIDCLLILVEAADDLGLGNTTVFLDIAADFAFSEIQDQPFPGSTLLTIRRLAETADVAIQKTTTPTFASRRLRPRLDSSDEQEFARSA